MTYSLDRTVISAGILLGMGFAGFFDGIVLHQVLQWHHMLTSIRPPTSLANLEINTFWDGLFHIGAFVLTAIGLRLLWRANQRKSLPSSPRPLLGSLLMGAGIFNLVEGLIDHQILGIHHVKSGANQFLWDMGFLVVAVFLILAGWLILQSYQQESVGSTNDVT